MKVANRFYVGAREILTNNWAQPTLEEAIEKGKRLLKEQGLEQVAIVEIIRVIRRQEPPLVVEKVEAVKPSKKKAVPKKKSQEDIDLEILASLNEHFPYTRVPYPPTRRR